MCRVGTARLESNLEKKFLAYNGGVLAGDLRKVYEGRRIPWEVFSTNFWKKENGAIGIAPRARLLSL